MNLKDRIEAEHKKAIEQRARLALAAQRGTRELLREFDRIAQEQAADHPPPKRTMPLTPPEGQ